MRFLAIDLLRTFFSHGAALKWAFPINEVVKVCIPPRVGYEAGG
jgi:hypothetical protein